MHLRSNVAGHGIHRRRRGRAEGARKRGAVERQMVGGGQSGADGGEVCDECGHAGLSKGERVGVKVEVIVGLGSVE